MGKVSGYLTVRTSGDTVGSVAALGLFHLRESEFGQEASLFYVTVLGKGSLLPQEYLSSGNIQTHPQSDLCHTYSSLLSVE